MVVNIDAIFSNLDVLAFRFGATTGNRDDNDDVDVVVRDGDVDRCCCCCLLVWTLIRGARPVLVPTPTPPVAPAIPILPDPADVNVDDDEHDIEENEFRRGK